MEILIWILAFAITITIHEAAHAWVANHLGDPTARLSGRLTLNPVKHYDPVGTTMLIVTALMSAYHLFPFPFGWAKPVPVDPYNLNDPRKDSALISLAGPLVNLVFALILSLVIRLIPGTFTFIILFPVILLNVSLAVFNLIPIHPLDGGKILAGILPKKESAEFDLFLNRYGMFLLLVLIFPFGGRSVITSIIGPIIGFILNLLVPGFGTI